MSKRPIFCVSSFYFAQEPLFELPRMNLRDLVAKMTDLATDRPIEFVALTSFLILGGVPIATFLAYAIATLLASVIGVVFFELFLLAIGATGLAIALSFVVCASSVIVSIFAALYYSYRIAVGTVKKARAPWPFSGSPTPADPSETQPDESFDKDK